MKSDNRVREVELVGGPADGMRLDVDSDAREIFIRHCYIVRDRKAIYDGRRLG